MSLLGLKEQCLFEAIRQDDEKEFRLRLKQKASVFGNDCQDPLTKETPLHHAITYQRYEMANVLLEKGADPNYDFDISGRNALMLATRTADEKMVKLLMEHGSDPDVLELTKGWNAMHFCAMFCFEACGESIANLLIEGGMEHPNLVSESDKISPLGMAAKQDNFHVARVLLENDFHEISFEECDLALAIAGAHGSKQVASLLIQHGANAHIPVPIASKENKSNCSPIHLARQHGHMALAKQMRLEFELFEEKQCQEEIKLISSSIINQCTND